MPIPLPIAAELIAARHDIPMETAKALVAAAVGEGSLPAWYLDWDPMVGRCWVRLDINDLARPQNPKGWRLDETRSIVFRPGQAACTLPSGLTLPRREASELRVVVDRDDVEKFDFLAKRRRPGRPRVAFLALLQELYPEGAPEWIDGERFTGKKLLEMAASRGLKGEVRSARGASGVPTEKIGAKIIFAFSRIAIDQHFSSHLVRLHQMKRKRVRCLSLHCLGGLSGPKPFLSASGIDLVRRCSGR